MRDVMTEPDGARLRRFKPYPAYKDSGVEWLGEIPAHWDVKKLAWLTECLDGRRVPLNAEERGTMQGDYPYWGANSIVDYVDRWLFDEELVLLGEDGAPFLDRTKSVAFRVSGKIWVNNHAHVLRPRRSVDAAFLAQALNCVDYGAFIDGTTRDKLTQGDMNSISIQFPPTLEQRSIAAFLDRETAKIDVLVAKKERLIDLLEEKWTALITRAVTKGLDSTVPMKNSGVEWLGEIPAHWEVKPLRWALSVRSGEGLSNTEFELSASEERVVPVIGGNGVMGYGDLSNIAAPCIAVGRVGALCGNVHMADPPAWVTDNALLLSDIRWFDRQYLALALEVLDLNRWASQNAQPLITGAFVKSQRICRPTLREQLEIVGHVRAEDEAIRRLTHRIQDAIDRLKELRTALISAAVTGKIDLRAAAAEASAG